MSGGSNELKEFQVKMKERLDLQRKRAEEEIAQQRMRDLEIALQPLMVQDKQGREVEVHQLVVSLANDALNADALAYNTDMRACLMSLLGIYKILAESLHKDMSDFVAKNISFPFYDKLNNLFTFDDSAAELMSELHNRVEFTDKDGLKVEPFKGSDAVVDGELNKVFSKLVDDWLNDFGYKPVAGSQGQYEKDGQRLTKQIFDGLANNKRQSLTEFLIADFDFKSNSPKP